MLSGGKAAAAAHRQPNTPDPPVQLLQTRQTDPSSSRRSRTNAQMSVGAKRTAAAADVDSAATFCRFYEMLGDSRSLSAGSSWGSDTTPHKNES